MRDSALRVLLAKILNDGIARWAGDPLPGGLTVQQAYQPRQEGVPIGPTVFYHPKSRLPVGTMSASDVPNADGTAMVHTQHQRVESTFQIAALVPQSPADIDGMTEIDVLDVMRWLLQDSVTIATLAPLNVGVLRVTTLTSAFFEDDRHQNENEPMFDIILSHGDTVTTTTPIIDEVLGGIYPV